jgi:hypothetical protein
MKLGRSLRAERRPRIFENRVLRRIFEPKRYEVTREWRKLHNEELGDLYKSPSICRFVKSRMRMGRVCNAYGIEGSWLQGFGEET